MSVYFDYFPRENHSGVDLVNITLMSRITDFVRANPYVFMPYVVEDYMRPEDVALYYYGSVKHTWLVFVSNEIIDPYYGWVMSDDVFNDYLAKKYYDSALEYYQSSNSAITEIGEYDVLNWTMNTKTNTNIIEYRNVEDDSINISPEGYMFISNNHISNVESVVVRDSCNNVITTTDPFWNNVNPTTYQPILDTGWYPMRVYDWEMEKNENKRHIQLIDRVYVSQLTSQLKSEFAK